MIRSAVLLTCLLLTCLLLAAGCGQKQRPAPAPRKAPSASQKAAPAPAPAAAVSLEEVLGKSCERGDARSCFVLGQKLMAGRGVAKDEARGRKMLVSACNRGHEQACSTAGVPMPYQARVLAGVPSNLRIGRFQSISIGSFLGPDGAILRAALSKPLEQACDCMVSYSKDLDLLGARELLVAGVVLDHRLSAAREPLDKVTKEKKAELSSLIPAGGEGAAQAAEPEQCKGAALTVRLWLLHSGNRKAPESLLVHGVGAKGPCKQSVQGAMEDLANNLVALLSNRYTRRVTLYKDSNQPELEEGNEHARNGAWKSALARYGAASEQAAARKLGPAPRGHIRYLQGMALAHLRRYEEALGALREARKINPEDRYLLELERVISAGSEGWSAPPPVERKAAGKGKKRRLYWQPRLKRKIVWDDQQ